MDWIDETICVGNWIDARNLDDLKSNGIDLIVDARALFNQGFLGKDREPIVERVLRIADLLVAISEKKPKVMIRCRRGRDRSPFVAMVYMSKKYGMPHEDAYGLVKQKVRRTVYHWDWVKMLVPHKQERCDQASS